MFIVMRDGPKKGEVQEMKFAVGQQLILAGRADLYDFGAKRVILTIDKKEPETSPSEPAAPKPRKKRR